MTWNSESKAWISSNILEKISQVEKDINLLCFKNYSATYGLNVIASYMPQFHQSISNSKVWSEKKNFMDFQLAWSPHILIYHLRMIWKIIQNDILNHCDSGAWVTGWPIARLLSKNILSCRAWFYVKSSKDLHKLPSLINNILTTLT